MTGWAAQHGFDVRLDWGHDGLANLAPVVDALVVVDVLSFTTCVDIAVGRGATVVPRDPESGLVPEGGTAAGTVMAIPRGAADAAHPWSLSPASLLALPAGTRLVLPSPNGSALSGTAARSGVRLVLAGCLRNASAVAAALTGVSRIGIVPAGERWGGRGPLRPAVEDLLGAGAVVAALARESCSPEARAAGAAFVEARPSLADRITECASGRELAEAGFADDVRLASEHDRSPIAAVLDGGAFRAFGG